MGTFEVREASLADAKPLASLVTQLGYPSNPREMKERLTGLLSDSCYAAFVAHDHSAVLGLGGGSLGKYFERNGVYARLVVLVVSDGARGLGVGSALVEAVESWALSRGARELFVNSATHREAAHRFYERCGFRMTGVRLAKSLDAPSQPVPRRGGRSYQLYVSSDGERCSLVEFETAEQLRAWRELPAHREAQRIGRERYYAEYSLQVFEQPLRESRFER